MRINFEKGEFQMMLKLLDNAFKFQLIQNDLTKYVLVELFQRFEAKKNRKQVTFKRSEAFALYSFFKDLQLSDASVQQVRNSIYNKFEKEFNDEQYL